MNNLFVSLAIEIFVVCAVYTCGAVIVSPQPRKMDTLRECLGGSLFVVLFIVAQIIIGVCGAALR